MHTAHSTTVPDLRASSPPASVALRLSAVTRERAAAACQRWVAAGAGGQAEVSGSTGKCYLAHSGAPLERQRVRLLAASTHLDGLQAAMLLVRRHQAVQARVPAWAGANRQMHPLAWC